jgi:catechol 2,3-dioxygenase-like lactoylglutathione lyase family enzyme
MAAVMRLQHTSIPMPDGGQEAARAFFGDALGMAEVKPPTSLNHMKLVWFKAGPDGHEVHLFTDPEMSQKSTAQHICLQVDNIEAYRARIAEKGIAIEETIEIPNRPRFFVRDPFNNQVEITQITGDYT